MSAHTKLLRMDVSGPPRTSDAFLVRIAKALDVDLARLADICEISYPDMLDLVSTKRNAVSRFDTDPMWNVLHEYVNQRIAYLMAVRLDLDVKMQGDRVRRIAHRMRQETHE